MHVEIYLLCMDDGILPHRTMVHVCVYFLLFAFKNTHSPMFKNVLPLRYRYRYRYLT